MAKITVNGIELYFEDSGGSGEPILFSHGLLWNASLFASQVAALKGRYRCVAYDHRGQGQSADMDSPEIDMDLLTDDVVALIAILGLGRVHFCGLSMGGYVGIRLAARYPHLVRSLILCDTSADAEVEESKLKYKLFCFLARWLGPRVIVGQVAPTMFGKTSLRDPARAADRADWLAELAKNRRSIWRAVNGVINRSAVYDELPKISAPTLVLVGDEDVATAPAKAERIAAAIPNARLVRIPRAGHSSMVEQPQDVNAAIEGFLAEGPRR